jgi:hypothetical protein
MIIDLNEVIDAVAGDTLAGFCVKCGAENGPVEPDARGYRCEACDEMSVYGAEELLFMIG